MSNKSAVINVKKPSECAEVELQDFAALVLSGGEVTANGLDARINNAEALVFLSVDHCLKGIAAVKRPAQTYKHSVFQKAQASARATDFALELGWIYVLPSSRRAGFSHVLVQAALGVTGERSIFATSRADNVPMHKVLSTHGLSCHGKAYLSNRGEQMLVLFISKICDHGRPT